MRGTPSHPRPWTFSVLKQPWWRLEYPHVEHLRLSFEVISMSGVQSLEMDITMVIILITSSPVEVGISHDITIYNGYDYGDLSISNWSILELHLGGSQIGVPPIIHFHRVFPYELFIWGARGYPPLMETTTFPSFPNDTWVTWPEQTLRRAHGAHRGFASRQQHGVRIKHQTVWEDHWIQFPHSTLQTTSRLKHVETTRKCGALHPASIQKLVL